MPCRSAQPAAWQLPLRAQHLAFNDTLETTSRHVEHIHPTAGHAPVAADDLVGRPKALDHFLLVHALEARQPALNYTIVAEMRRVPQ